MELPINKFFYKIVAVQDGTKILENGKEEPGVKGRKYNAGRKIAFGILAVLFAAAAGFFIYIQVYYHAKPDMQEVWAGSGAGQVREIALEKWITYGNTESGRGFIFYPGAKVEEEAYGPLMREIAEEGFFCVLVRMPGRMAVLGSGAAADAAAAYPEIGEWYLGGHSLGGAMAAGYAAEHAKELSGLVLLAAYSTKPLPETVPVLSVYGSRDGVLNLEKYEECRENLPKTAEEYVIEGGNHAGFGWYGEQKGDGKAEITPQEQWRLTAAEIGRWAVDWKAAE